jgi:hypothetical protein
MDKNKYYTTEIKTRLKMPEILRFYGFKIKRGNRIPCPFHSGQDENCGVKNDYIHCFVCGESADQIGFVQKYFNLSFSDAIRKINDDFCLGLPLGEKIDKRKRIEISKRCFEIKKQKEKELQEKTLIEKEYDEALSDWIRLDMQRRLYAPMYETDELHPLFVEAITRIEQAQYRLDCAEMRLDRYGKHTNN